MNQVKDPERLAGAAPLPAAGAPPPWPQAASAATVPAAAVAVIAPRITDRRVPPAAVFATPAVAPAAAISLLPPALGVPRRLAATRYVHHDLALTRPRPRPPRPRAGAARPADVQVHRQAPAGPVRPAGG